MPAALFVVFLYSFSALSLSASLDCDLLSPAAAWPAAGGQFGPRTIAGTMYDAVDVFFDDRTFVAAGGFTFEISSGTSNTACVFFFAGVRVSRNKSCRLLVCVWCVECVALYTILFRTPFFLGFVCRFNNFQAFPIPIVYVALFKPNFFSAKDNTRTLIDASAARTALRRCVRANTAALVVSWDNISPPWLLPRTTESESRRFF